MTTLTYSASLVVEECWCGIQHAIPQELHRRAHSEGATVYCPLGHAWAIQETEVHSLTRQLRQARDEATAVRAERDQAEASRRAWKGQATRARKAVLSGQCPFCGQHLRDIARHVSRMHEDELTKEHEAEPAEPTPIREGGAA